MIFNLISLNIFAQNKTFEICKIDSISERVFIFTSRKYISDLSNASKVIDETKKQFVKFERLNISFFDNTNDCGYQIENIEIYNDSLVRMKVNDVKKHWFAEYSKQSNKLSYYRDDGSFSVLKEYVIIK